VAVRPRLLKGSLLVAVAVIAASVVWFATRDTGEPLGASDPIPTDGGIAVNSDVTGDTLPSATVVTLDGTAVDTASLTGKPLVINIWFSTCVPCRKELPAFAAVSGDLKGVVDFVGINQFPASDTEEDFARDLGVTYPLFYDGDGRFITQLGVTRYPVTLFVLPDGTIARQTGELDEAELRATIDEVFA
jgi:thiol-disulfide isomerase/thioredoxin